MHINDIEIAISGGNGEARAMVATAIEGSLDNLGFTNIQNVDADESADLDTRMTYADKIAERYPNILTTQVTITTVADEAELDQDPDLDVEEIPGVALDIEDEAA